MNWKTARSLVEMDEENNKDHNSGILKRKRSPLLKCKGCDFYGKNQQQLEEHQGLHDDSDVDDPTPKRSSTDRAFKAKITKSIDYKLPNAPQGSSDEPKIPSDHCKSDEITSHCINEDVSNCTPFKCDCGKFFKTQRILTKHIQNKTAGKPFKCSDCDFACNRSNTLKVHKMVHTDEKPYHCNLCDYACRHGNMLKHHNRVKHGVDPFPCGKCDFTADRINVLFNHQFNEHGVPRPQACKICGRRFNQKETLKVHMKIHSPDKPFSCKVCNRNFRLLDTLKVHINTHLEEKAFNCENCDKSYHSKVGLLKHRERKHENKPRKMYTCDVCSSVFTTHNGLKTHKMSHTGEKPFKCDQCDYRTRNEFNLQKHKYVHNGLKPFKCPFCDYACRNPSNLSVHKKTHIASHKTLSDSDIKPDMSGNIRVRIKSEAFESPPKSGVSEDHKIVKIKLELGACRKIRLYHSSVKEENLSSEINESSGIKLENDPPSIRFDFTNVAVKQEPIQ